MDGKRISILLGKNIALRRKKLHITQAKLAEMLNIGQEALSRMENGIIAPKMERLDDLAGILSCSVADLFRETEENSESRTNVIVDLIYTLPEESQDAVVRLVSDMARILRRQ